MSKEIALANEILRGVVGSTSHGTAIEGQDDRDEMGVFIEPPENVCGLTPCEHYIYRDQPEGHRSQPGDLDLTMYSLRKFCKLATQGNPSVVVVLWLPSHMTKTTLGADLVRMREAFISRESGARFLGYLVAQKMKLKGERAHTVNRPELVAKYGYDTKFAMHALRLAFQGIEMLTSRRITLPVAEPDLTTLRAVRSGQISFADALKLIEDTEANLRALLADCNWVADKEAIDAFMVRAHTTHWAALAPMTDTPQRIQRKRTPGWRMPPNTIYVGRGTAFGNPFTVDAAAEAFDCRKESAHRYVVDWFQQWLADENPERFGPLGQWGDTAKQRETLLRRLPELRGKNLACFCRHDLACHADVLLKLANTTTREIGPRRDGLGEEAAGEQK